MRGLAFFMTITMLTGCISALPPTAKVVGATVTETSEQGASLEVLVEVSHDNANALPVPVVNYALVVEGVGRYEFSEKPIRVLPPRGQQVLTLPAALAFIRDGDGSRVDSLAGRPWRISGTLVYEADSDLRSFLTESGVPLPIVLFNGRGVFEGVSATR
jgi:hypothetical protein